MAPGNSSADTNRRATTTASCSPAAMRKVTFSDTPGSFENQVYARMSPVMYNPLVVELKRGSRGESSMVQRFSPTADIAMMRASRFFRVSGFREDVIQYSAFWRYEGASLEKYAQASVSALKIRVSAGVSFARSRCS